MNTINNTKKTLYIVLGVIIVIALGFGINSYIKNREPKPDLSLQEILNLSEKERIAALEAQVGDLKRESQRLAENAEAGTKFSVYIRLAEAQIAIGKYDEAIETLNAIPEEKKNTSRTPIAYARAYKGKNDFGKAKENIDKALVIDNELPEALLLNLEISAATLPNDQLDALYRDAITKTKSNLDIIISYARFSEKIGNKPQAIAAWETARNLNPEKSADYEAEMARLKQ